MLALWKRYRHLNWAMADQGMVSAVNFLTGLLLARYLGLEEFGRYTLAWMAVEFLQSFQHSLIIAPMMSLGPQEERSRWKFYLGSVVSCQAILTLVSMTLFVAAIYVLSTAKPEWRMEGIILPLAAAALASQLQNFVRRYLFTCNRGEYAFAIDFVRYGGQIIVLAVLFLSVTSLKMDAGSCLWVVAGASAASAFAGGLAFEAIGLQADIFRQTVRRHWDFAKWLMSSELLRWGCGNLFIAASGALLGAATVGAIRAAQNLVGLCHIVLLGLENVVPVRAARIYSAEGIRALLDLLKKVALWGGLIIGFIVLIAAVVPEFWMRLLYGPEYSQQGYLVRWWAAVYFVGFFNLPATFGLRTLSSTRAIFFAQFVAAAFTAVAVYPLLKYLGATGAMVGYLSIVVIQGSVLYRNFFRHMSFKPARVGVTDA